MSNKQTINTHIRNPSNMPIQNARTPSRLTLAIAAIVLAQAVQAAEQQTGLEEITVTAQKRE